MIKVTMYVNKEGQHIGFRSEGHDESEMSGQSLICAGVSTAVFGAYYFIEYGTSAKVTMDSEPGLLKVQLKHPNHDAEVALRQLISTLTMVKTQYGDIKIDIKEGAYAS